MKKGGMNPDGSSTGLGTGNSRLHIADSLPDSDPLIIMVSDASNCPYKYRPLEPGKAFAHLLSIGSIIHLQHNGYESPVCDVFAHEWWNGVRLLGIQEGATPTSIHQGFNDLRSLILKNWKRLAGYAGGGVPQGMSALVKGEDGQWFTQHPKIGESMDTYEPEFPVLSREPIGEPVTFKTTVGGYHGFFKYGLHEVTAIAPHGANAYEEVSDVEIVWTDGNPTHQTCLVQFYQAEIDDSRRLPTVDQIKNDYSLLMSLTEG